MKLNVALALVLAGSGYSQESNTAATELIDLFGRITSYTAEFKQLTRDARDEVIETQIGRVVFSRTNGLRWQVNEPFSQVIVAKRNVLYVHDLDLEQLTMRTLSDLPDSAFTLLLMNASEESLSEFDVRNLTGADKTFGIGYGLKPNSKGSFFQDLRVYFVDTVITRIDVVDHFGHRTEVLFRNSIANQVVELEEFEITVPEGTDVIGDVTDRDSSG